MENVKKKITEFSAKLSKLNLIKKLIDKIHKLDPRDNTTQRVMAALVMIPVALYAIFGSKSFFIFLAISLAIAMTMEWMEMIRAMEDQKKWRLIGFVYILLPVAAVIKIRVIDSNILFWMFSIIWVTDIFAFFAGRILGGAKLAPAISPNKTWSGLFGGVVASVFIGFLSSFMFSGGVTFFIIISVFLSVIEQLSDLLESKFKRIFGVKDSGNIIPGHGGVLDRLDGMMLVAPLVLLLVCLAPGKFGM